MTDIRLYDTASRTKTPVTPGIDGRVGMYVCGPTVYDRAHIGNARPVVVFDVLFRLLRHRFGAEAVRYVRNFTDVDDKILKRADETGREIGAITEETIGWYLEDMGALGALEPDEMPRATDYVNNAAQPVDMVRMIGTLITRGHAYEAEGHVLFAVKSWAAYGSLSRRSTDELLAGARVDVAPYKRDPMDFVLWKPSTPDQPGWESPWGRGRPGWHIECSAMAKALLDPWMGGGRFQIHGGGIDLVFPHHENERAQSCAAHGTEDMADIWMHNGYLMVEGEKMSKSLGNFITVKDLRERGIPGEVIRYVLLKTHYRQPLDWTEEAVAEATRVVNRWRRALDAAGAEVGAPPPAMTEALAEDLNTWEAFQVIDHEAKAVLDGRGDGTAFLGGLALVGFEELESAAMRDRATKAAAGADVGTEIERLLAARVAARKAKDFARADAIRDGLTAAGVEVRDGPDGSAWSLGTSFDAAKLAELEAEA